MLPRCTCNSFQKILGTVTDTFPKCACSITKPSALCPHVCNRHYGVRRPEQTSRKRWLRIARHISDKPQIPADSLAVAYPLHSARQLIATVLRMNPSLGQAMDGIVKSKTTRNLYHDIDISGLVETRHLDIGILAFQVPKRLRRLTRKQRRCIARSKKRLKEQ